MHATSGLRSSITNPVSIIELALQSKQSHCISFQSLLQPILQGGTESCTVQRISPMLTNSIFLKMDSAKILPCSYQDIQLMTPCTIQTNIKISFQNTLIYWLFCKKCRLLCVMVYIKSHHAIRQANKFINLVSLQTTIKGTHNYYYYHFRTSTKRKLNS